MANNRITFCKIAEPYGCFSNFSRHSITVDGISYRTTEHYYQAQKVCDLAERKKIASIFNQKEAKIYACTLPLREDWNDIKYNVMLETLRYKVEQNPEVRETLLSTSDSEIVEYSRFDKYWGSGADFSGMNMLGKAWMEIREELRGNTKSN